jgi:hypothetical protein
MGSAHSRISKAVAAASVSRRRHEYRAFRDLCSSIAAQLKDRDAVIDGEISCVGTSSVVRSSMNCYFGAVRPTCTRSTCSGSTVGISEICRSSKRKTRLRKLLGRRRRSRILYLDHLEKNGSGLFRQACKLDLEGIVPKWEVRPLHPRQQTLDMDEDQEPALHPSGRARRALRTTITLSRLPRPAFFRGPLCRTADRCRVPREHNPSLRPSGP